MFMKLDATDLRYITSDEFRVLTAVRTFSHDNDGAKVVAYFFIDFRWKWAQRTTKLYPQYSSSKFLAYGMVE